MIISAVTPMRRRIFNRPDLWGGWLGRPVPVVLIVPDAGYIIKTDGIVKQKVLTVQAQRTLGTAQRVGAHTVIRSDVGRREGAHG